MYPVLMVTFDDWYYSIGTYLFAIAFGLLYFAVASAPFRLYPENWRRVSLLANKAVKTVTLRCD
jgi:hypothetical protein